MFDVTLIPIDASMAEALSLGPANFRQHYGAELGESLDPIRAVVQQTLSMAPQPPPWGGYLAVQEEGDLVVGTCGFNGGPSPDGAVEIAYGTLPPFQGRGVATAMAARLLELAWEQREVRSAVAHTLPEPSASTRVLQRLGFERDGEAVDPDEGPVWRWSLPRPDSPPHP